MSFGVGVLVGALGVVLVEVVIALITAADMKGEKKDGNF